MLVDLRPMCLLFIVGCTRPLYIPPPDPYDLSNEKYTAALPVMESVIHKTANSDTWFESTTEESRVESRAMKSMADLARQGHPPAMYLVGKHLMAGFTTFKLSGGLNGKFKNEYRRTLKKFKKTGKQFEEELEMAFFIGFDLSWGAARYGYQPAVKFLKEINISPPEKDLYTAAEIRAQKEYNDALAGYESQKNLVAGVIVGALAAGATVAAAEAAGSSPGYSASPSYSTFAGQCQRSYFSVAKDQSRVSHIGCCSYHQGIAMDFFQHTKCDSLTNKVVCNDGCQSPTCYCQ